MFFNTFAAVDTAIDCHRRRLESSGRYEHSQVPLPNRLAPFKKDIVVSSVGVTKLLKGLNPSKALGPVDLINFILES